MTTPDDSTPDETTATPFSLVPGGPVPSSLSDRLAELEADDEDDPLFDDFDDEPDDTYDGEQPQAEADHPRAHEVSGAAGAAADDGPFAVGAAEEPAALVPGDAADPTVEPVPEPMTEPVTERRTQRETEAGTDAGAEHEAEAGTERETEVGAERETEAVTEPRTEREAEAGPGAAAAVTAPLAAGVVVPPTPTEVDGQPTADDQPGAAPRGRARRRRISLPVIALLLMTLLMAAATAYLWQQVREHDRAEAARKAGLETSRDAARLLFSYDYRTLDKDFATGRGLTTGNFRSQYEKTTTKVVSDVAKQYKAVVKANVVSAGVVSATPDKVVTIVYVNQVTTSTRVTGEKVDLSRVRMTLRKVGDRWLVSEVNAL